MKWTHALGFCAFGILGLIALPQSTQAYHIPSTSPVTIYSASGTQEFTLPNGNLAGGASLITSDLGEDGIPEILVGNGLGNEPRVRVLRKDGSEIGSFLAYAPSMGVGIQLAACDLNNDGTQEIITAPMKGGGPHIRIFSHLGKAIDNGGFFAYTQAFTGGVNVTCGDIDQDGKAELVTLPAPGGGPHVRIWKFNNGKTTLWNEFFAFAPEHNKGVVGYAGDGFLTVVSQQGNNPALKTYRWSSGLHMTNGQVLNTNAAGVTGMFFKDGTIQITTAGPSTIYNLTTKESHAIESAYNSIVAASGDLDSDGSDDLVVAPFRPMFSDRTEGKYIKVDISEQRLYAYENGTLAHTFLISSAKAPNTTPIGEHTVLAKVPEVHYKWTYGPNDPRNYDLGLIPYNLRIYPHIYIHYAPWHNNFGHPMSRGCINVNLANIKWIYNWAEEGIPVTVQA